MSNVRANSSPWRRVIQDIPRHPGSLPGQDQRLMPRGVRGGVGVPEKLSPEGLCLKDSEKGQVAGSSGDKGIKKRIN